MDVRFGGFTTRVDCPFCGQPVPLNAPLERSHCAACLRDFPVPGEIFRRLLVRFDDLYPNGEPSALAAIAGLQVHVTSAASAPSCEKCGTAFDLAGVARDALHTFHCTACGDAAVGFPPPPWLQALVPTATYVAVTDASALPGATAAAPARDASHPVVLPCPQCGAPLHITSDSARTLPCEYCKTDVYLPDDLWRRLHPMKTMAPWFVRFEGASRADLEREAGARARLEEEARYTNAYAAQQLLSLEISARLAAAQKKKISIARLGVVGAGLALVLGLSMLAYGLPFLLRDGPYSRFDDSRGFQPFFWGIPITVLAVVGLIQAITVVRSKPVAEE